MVDEAWKVFGNVADGLVGHWIDRFDLHRLHEALRFGVIVGIATPAHRADEAMAVEGLPIGLRGILRAAIRVMKAAGRRFAVLDCGVQSRERQPDIDGSADGVADDAARPGVENHRDVNEARRDCDVGDVGDPELIGAVDDLVLGQIAEDRMVVVAVCRRHISPTHAWLEIVLAHEALDLLVIDHEALLAKGGLHASPTVAFERVADRAHRLDDGCVVERHGRRVIVGRA